MSTHSADLARPLVPARRSPPLRARWSFLYAGISLAAGIAHVVSGSAARESIYSIVALSVVPVLVTGVRHNRGTPHPVWRWFGTALVLYVVAELVRDYLSASSASVPADVLAIAGYLCQIRGLAMLIRARNERMGRNAAADAIVVGAAAWIVAWVFLMEPALQHMSTVEALVEGCFQPLAVVIVFHLCILLMSDGFRTSAFWMLAGSMVLALFGDFGYALVQARQLSFDTDNFDVLYVVSFGLIGAAVLHPSMRSITEVRPARSAGWSSARMITLGAAMFAPAAAVIGVAGQGPFATVRIVSVLMFACIATSRVLLAVREETTATRALLQAALWDPLTSTTTRVGFFRELGDLRERDRVGGSTTAVALVDVHGFRRINDSLGHDAGDQVLKAVAERLRRLLGPDDVLSRLAGDEFALALGGQADAREARQRARDVHAAFDVPIDIDGRSLSLSVRVGVAVAVGDDDTSAQELVRCADTALHQAKSDRGPSVVVFTEQMRRAVDERLEIESGLRTALERDEFHLVFQPVVEVASGRLASMEALLRWHRDGTPIGPAEFVPVAETNGLILPMGRWALRESLRQFRRWLDDGVCPDDSYVAVNLSSRQIDDRGLVAFLVETLRTERVRPDQLCLELTETAMMERVDEASATFDRLRQLGIRLAIDDFGTGFSSLGQIKRLPLDIIKIDRAFVLGIDVSVDDRELIAAIVGLATALGKVVIAEGVETAAQLDVLRDLGVGLAQGYLLARPAPADEFADRVLDISRRFGSTPADLAGESVHQPR